LSHIGLALPRSAIAIEPGHANVVAKEYLKLNVCNSTAPGFKSLDNDADAGHERCTAPVSTSR
jgi:hypothetical protein